MPYTSTALVFPQMGKQGELRALLEERVRNMQSGGLRANLAVTAFGDNPAFYAKIVHPDLAAADAFRDGPLAPQRDPAFVARIATLVRQPTRNALRQVLLAGAPASGLAPIRYNFITKLVPQPAAARRVVTQVLERARTEQTRGGVLNVSVPVAGSRGIYIGRLFRSLAELERHREAAAEDSEFQRQVEESLPLMAEPPEFEVREILIPLSPA